MKAGKKIRITLDEETSNAIKQALILVYRGYEDPLEAHRVAELAKHAVRAVAEAIIRQEFFAMPIAVDLRTETPKETSNRIFVKYGPNSHSSREWN